MKSSIALIAYTVLLTSVIGTYQSDSKFQHHVFNVERQAVMNASFFHEQHKFNRFQQATKDSTKRETLGPHETMLNGVGRVKKYQLQNSKFRQNSNNNIGKITLRDYKDMLSMKNAPLKLQQQLNKNLKRVRKDVESDNQNLTEQIIQCEVSSLSCKNCCEDSDNCSHRATFCRCDTQCSFFNDCCVDYETFCGKEELISFGVDSQGLSCMKPNHVEMKSESSLDMVWIMNKCPRNRKSDEISRNCENADKLELNVSNIQNLVPVIDKNKLIFRNEFCAQCNSIEQFDYFGFDISCYIVPPSSITSFAQLVEFASRYCDPKRKISIFRKDSQPVRECIQNFRHFCPTWTQLKDKCERSKTSDRTHWCEILLANSDDQSKDAMPGSPGSQGEHGISFTHVSLIAVLRFQSGPSVSRVKETICLSHKFYDDYLETCREGDSIPLIKENLDKYYIAVWLDGKIQDPLPSPDEIASSFAQLFNFQRSQVSDLRIDLDSSHELSLWIVVFKLTLTNEQTLLLAKAKNTTTNNVSSKIEEDSNNLTNSLPLQRLLFFSRKFNVTLQKTRTIHKTTSRQLACIRKQTFPQGTYTSTQNGNYYYINSTGESFARKQVFFEGMNISICEQIVFSDCVGRKVNLTSEEYVKFDNLSIFYNRTNTIYDFGEYDIEDGDIFMCVPEGPPQFFVYTPKNSVIQIYLTWICFALSLTCLFVVIQTYLIFPELRKLPGKNLLSLSVSLFLAQLLWLIPDRYYTSTLCHVIASIKHYVFLVSFVAMATIAWHTHTVFASKNVRKDLSKNRERKKFYKYSAIVWGLPGMFAVICAVIDGKDVYPVYVHEQWCWFDNAHAQQYLFVLPVGLLLLFNVIFFTLTVLRIRRVRASTKLIHSDQSPRDMFWIYLKISTLMGFSWLFGFIYLLAPSIQVFSYLFVIFASLQGVYIALAFVVKKDIWEKYKTLVRKKRAKNFRPDYRSTLLDDLSKSRETKV